MSGFASPNYTQVPNDLFTLMRDMGEAELKVVLHAVRQTIGYHRERDAISLTQFEAATGLSRPGVVSGIEAAIKRGVLKEAGVGLRGVKYYELVIELVNEVNQLTELTSTSQQGLPDLVNSVNTQKKEKKPKEKQDDDDDARARARAKDGELEELEPFNIFALYHTTFARMVSNPILADDLKDMAATYPHDWIQDAFKQAALANATSHKYALTCLQRWQKEGRTPKPNVRIVPSQEKKQAHSTPPVNTSKPKRAEYPADEPDMQTMFYYRSLGMENLKPEQRAAVTRFFGT